jgi:hypothetical protein
MALNAIINNTERLGVKNTIFGVPMLKRQKSSHTGNFKLAFKIENCVEWEIFAEKGERKEEEIKIYLFILKC